MTESDNDGCIIEGDSARTKEVECKYQRKEVKFSPNVQIRNNHMIFSDLEMLKWFPLGLRKIFRLGNLPVIYQGWIGEVVIYW